MTRILSAVIAVVLLLLISSGPQAKRPASSVFKTTVQASSLIEERHQEPVSRTLVRPTPPRPKPPHRLTAREYARALLGARSYRCADVIFTAESHWNPLAQNRKDSAFGIAQFLDSTWKNTGVKKTSDPLRQIYAASVYFKRHYGSAGACGALAFRASHGYY